MEATLAHETAHDLQRLAAATESNMESRLALIPNQVDGDCVAHELHAPFCDGLIQAPQHADSLLLADDASFELVAAVDSLAQLKRLQQLPE